MGLQPSWDREKFRDEWMSSGVQNVGDMNSWLQNSGWGDYVQTGGKKGDLMYLPNGDTIDAVYAAGAGGNKAGPMWTGKGNWQDEGKQSYDPNYQSGGGGQQYGGPQYGQSYGNNGWNGYSYGNQNQGSIGPSAQEMQKQQLNQQHRQFQSQQRNRQWNQQTGMQPQSGPRMY